jgi:hypothetical protein
MKARTQPLHLILLICFMCSCTQRLKVPVNRMMSPEAIGGGAEIEFQRIDFSEARLDFNGGQTDNPLKMPGVVSNRTLYMAVGVSPTTDIFVKIPQESSSLLGIKVQLLGAGSKFRNITHQFAFTLAMGAERDTFEGPYRIDLKSDVRDYSLIYGYRLNQYLLAYTSVSLSDYRFRGNVKDSGGALVDDTIDYRAENVLGAQMGVDFGIPGFSIKYEFALQKIQWTNSEEKLFYSNGLALKAAY